MRETLPHNSIWRICLPGNSVAKWIQFHWDKCPNSAGKPQDLSIIEKVTEKTVSTGGKTLSKAQAIKEVSC
jgi:hypothetical protein